MPMGVVRSAADRSQRGEAAGAATQVPTSIIRYLGRSFYAAVAAAIAHTINTTRQLAAMYSKGVMAPSPRYPAWQSCLSRDIGATGLWTSTGSTSVGIRTYQVAACGGLGNAKSS